MARAGVSEGMAPLKPTKILRAAALAVVSLVGSSLNGLAQPAQVNFSGGAGLVCPAANGRVTTWLGNWSGSSQTIQATFNAPTAIIFDFPAPVTNVEFRNFPPGLTHTRSGNRLTVILRQSVTFEQFSSPFIVDAYLDLRGTRDGTPITVTATTSPPNAVEFDGGVNTSVFSIADDEVCTPAPPSSFTLDDVLRSCPSAQDIAAFNAVLRLQFESDPSAGKLVCRAADGSADLTYLQERTYQALRVLQQMPFDAPLPWTAKPLFEWFTGAIRGIRFRANSGTFCCEPAGFINIETNNLALLRFANDPTLASVLPFVVVNLAGLFVHEARHNEAGAHTCGTNDRTLSEMGAWAVQIFFYEWVAFRTGSFVTPEAPNRQTTAVRGPAWDTASVMLRSGYCDCGLKVLSGWVTISPSELDFGTQPVFAPSAPRSVPITSTLGDPVTIREVAVSGPNAADFSVTNSCVDTYLPPSCPVVVRFTPSAAGPRVAQLTAVLSNGLRRTAELRGQGGR